MTEDEMNGWHTNPMDMSFNKLQEMVKDRGVWCAAIHGVARGQIRLSNFHLLFHLGFTFFALLSCLFL